MDYLFNLFLMAVRPVGFLILLFALTFLLPRFGMSTRTYRKVRENRLWLLGLAVVLVVVFNAASPTITPKNSTSPRTMVTVPVEIHSPPIVDNTRQPKHTDEEREERFNDLTDWKKRRAEAAEEESSEK